MFCILSIFCIFWIVCLFFMLGLYLLHIKNTSCVFFALVLHIAHTNLAQILHKFFINSIESAQNQLRFIGPYQPPGQVQGQGPPRPSVAADRGRQRGSTGGRRRPPTAADGRCSVCLRPRRRPAAAGRRCWPPATGRHRCGSGRSQPSAACRRRRMSRRQRRQSEDSLSAATSWSRSSAAPNFAFSWRDLANLWRSC